MKIRKSSNIQFYTVSVRSFVIPFNYGSGSGTVINYASHPLKPIIGTVPVPLWPKRYGSYGSDFNFGSATLI
jgi:hypothetical protein